jgi:signal recognition particle receptor subunit beta
VFVVPTMGQNSKRFSGGGFKMELLDIGGSERYDKTWEFYSNSDALLYVIDGTDGKERLLVALDALSNLLRLEDLQGIPLCIAINKQDLDGCWDIDEVRRMIEEEEELSSLRERLVGKTWKVEGTSGVEGTQSFQHCHKAFEWILEILRTDEVARSRSQKIAR